MNGPRASFRAWGWRFLRQLCARSWFAPAFRRRPSEHGSRGGRSCVQQAASLPACDFFTVETLGLQRIDVLFFISLATRRLEFIACTPNPDGAWVTQQAHNLVMQLGGQEPPSGC